MTKDQALDLNKGDWIYDYRFLYPYIVIEAILVSSYEEFRCQCFDGSCVTLFLDDMGKFQLVEETTATAVKCRILEYKIMELESKFNAVINAINLNLS